MMDYKEAVELINIDPDIDPDIFWPAIGILAHDVTRIAASGSLQLGIELASALACMEIGAVLARPDLVRELNDQI